VQKAYSSNTLVGCKCVPAVTPLDGPLGLIAQSMFCGTFSLSHINSCENIAAAGDACKNPSSSLSHILCSLGSCARACLRLHYNCKSSSRRIVLIIVCCGNPNLGSHQNKESLLCSRFSFRNNEELVYSLFTIIDLLTGMELGYVHKYCFYYIQRAKYRYPIQK